MVGIVAIVFPRKYIQLDVLKILMSSQAIKALRDIVTKVVVLNEFRVTRQSSAPRARAFVEARLYGSC